VTIIAIFVFWAVFYEIALSIVLMVWRMAKAAVKGMRNDS
jgi:hypothetical protein